VVRPANGLFGSMWRHVASKPVRSLAFLLVVALLICATSAVSLRMFSPRTLITVGAFDIQDKQAKALGSNGKNLANMLVDDLQAAIQEADSFVGNEFSSRRQYSAIPNAPHIPVQTDFRGAGIKGISIDQVIAIWDYLRYDHYVVSGDLKGLGADGVELTVRYVGEQRSDSFDADVPESKLSLVKSGLANLAPQVLGGINPEMGARYYANLAWACEASGCRKAYALRAVDLCSKWITREPNQPKAYFYLGYAFYQAEEDDSAASALDQAIHLNPQLGIAYSIKGVVLMRLGKFPEAEEALTKVNTPNTLTNLGLIKLVQGKYAEAVIYYRQAVYADPDNAGNYSNLGSALLCLGKNAEAVSVFQKALDLKPTMYPALRGLSLALARTGNADEALKRCQLALTLNPESLYPQWIEGQVWLDRQDGTRNHNGAMAADILKGVLEKVKAKEVFAPDLMTDLGKAYLMENHVQLAKHTFESVIDQIQTAKEPNRPRDPEPLARAHLHLGRVLGLMGQPAKSKAELDLADNLDARLRFEHPEDW
jgi:tetratricopeptide (TPR) repeat protein